MDLSHPVVLADYDDRGNITKQGYALADGKSYDPDRTTIYGYNEYNELIYQKYNTDSDTEVVMERFPDPDGESRENGVSLR